MAYIPLKAGAQPTLGSSGDAVKAFQNSLNSANAGKAGYSPIKEDGLYGPLTQSAANFKPSAPNPAPAPAPTVDATRFVRTPNSNDTEISRLERTISDYTTKEPDLASITATNRANAQAVIDSVNAEFQKTITDAMGVGEGMNKRVRSLNSSSGLQGSDFGTAAAVGQEKKNQKVLDSIEAEKAAKVQAILSNVDNRSSEQYRAEREQYVAGLKDDLASKNATKDEDRKRALESITGLAGAGISIEKLKTADPTSYATLLGEYGGSQIDMETAWNESLPDNMKVKYSDKIIQGPNGDAVLFRYGLNPVTGTVDQKEYNLGVDYNSLSGAKPVTLNGRLYTMTTDSQGNQIAKPLTDAKGTGTGTTTKGAVKSGKATFSADQISSFSSELEKSKGPDNYVNPDVYQQAFEAWTDPDVGGLAKDFLLKYPPKKYVNPANTTLPDYLRSSTTKPKSSREL